MGLCQFMQLRSVGAGRAINRLFKIITGLPGNPADGLKGGFLSVFDLSTFALVTEPIGEISQATRFRDFQAANQLVRESPIVRGRRIRSDGIAAVNKLGCSFSYGNLIVGFIGFSNKSLNQAFSLIFSIYINFTGNDAPAESFRTIANRLIEENCSDNEYVDLILDQFLSWYARIELGQGEKIRTLICDDNDDRLEVIDDLLLEWKIFQTTLVDTLDDAKGKELKDFDLIICTETFININDGSEWLHELTKEGKKVINLLVSDNPCPEISFLDCKQQNRNNNFGIDECQLLDLICEEMKI